MDVSCSRTSPCMCINSDLLSSSSSSPHFPFTPSLIPFLIMLSAILLLPFLAAWSAATIVPECEKATIIVSLYLQYYTTSSYMGNSTTRARLWTSSRNPGDCNVAHRVKRTRNGMATAGLQLHNQVSTSARFFRTRS